MMINNKLTIVLTIKGRYLHTLRWLWHANKIHLPFHVIIADGEVHPTINRLLSDHATFPNISYEYHRYDDAGVIEFYSKVVDALAKVKTLYVMRSDNDDFLSPFGIEKALAFLEKSSDYACAGGGIPGFSINSKAAHIKNVTGAIKNLSYRYISNAWYQCRDIKFESISDRILEQIKSPLAVHYYIYRTTELNIIVNEILASKINFSLCEMYLNLRTLTFGKIRSDPSHMIYYRQQETSQLLGYSTDILNDLVCSDLVADFRSMASRISIQAACNQCCDPTKINNKMYKAYISQLREKLASAELRRRFPLFFKLRRLLAAIPWPRLSARLRFSIQKKAFWRAILSDGADNAVIAAHSKELDQIVLTLQGKDFLEFIMGSAADLLDVEKI